MAVPSDVTESVITAAALSDAGISSTTYSTLASSNWLPEAKEYVWTRFKKARDFQQTKIAISVKGVREYAMPTDYDRGLEVAILDGDTRGTAQAGAADSITLAAADSSTEDYVVGKYILIYSGTGAGGYQQCKTFSTTTKVATMDGNWNTTPDSTSLYMIISYRYTLKPALISALDASFFSVGEKARPEFYAEYDDKLYLGKVPDQSYYGILFRYYSNIMKADTSDAVYTLFLNRFRNVLQKYIEVKALKRMDDTRAEKEERELARMTAYLIAKQIENVSGLQRVVADV